MRPEDDDITPEDERRGEERAYGDDFDGYEIGRVEDRYLDQMLGKV